MINELLEQNKEKVAISIVAVVIILSIVLLYSFLYYKNKDNSKYFPDYEKIEINEKSLKDKEKYNKIISQLENDKLFNNTLMISDYESQTASKKDLENMITNFLLIFELNNTKYMKNHDKEKKVFCLTETSLLNSFKELYNTDISDYLDSLVYYFEHVYKNENYCMYYGYINHKYGKSKIINITNLTYSNEVVTVESYVYSYDASKLANINEKEKRLKDYIDKDDNVNATSVVENELLGQAEKKRISFKINNNANYFKYQVLSIKTID